MAEKITPFNSIKILYSDAEIAELLAEAYEDKDPAVFVSVLGEVVKLKGVAQMAEATGLNRESLYKVINGTTQPKWSTVHKLLHALDVHLAVTAA